jgi:hypothetical protein
VALQVPPNLLGNYHLGNCPASPACNLGAASKAVPSYQQPPAALAAPATDIDDQARPALGGFDSGADEFGGGTGPPPPSSSLYFSTVGDSNPPGVAGTADDADIYLWNGTAFSRSVDATAITNPVPVTANVDGFDRVDDTHAYVSFTGDVTISLPGPDLTVQDEDVLFYNAGTWSVFFDGTPAATRGLSGTDIDAFNIVGGVLYFSTSDSTVPVGVAGAGDDADIYSWNGTSFSRVIDASAAPYSLPAAANVDGFVRVDATHFYLSFAADTTLPALGAVQDEDVVLYDAGTWSVSFDGTSHGLTSASLSVDAFDVA